MQTDQNQINALNERIDLFLSGQDTSEENAQQINGFLINLFYEDEKISDLIQDIDLYKPFDKDFYDQKAIARKLEYLKQLLKGNNV